MLDKRDFDISLKYGELGEAQLKALLGNKTIEVKRDNEMVGTGNIFVEFEDRGRLSGIRVTKADWWGFINAGADDEVIILIKTSRLKKLAKMYYDKS